MDCGEPVGDSVQRFALRASLFAFYGGGLLALSALLVPGSTAGSAGASWLRFEPAAHARAMALGFCSLFVLSFLCRMVPRATHAALCRPRFARVGAAALLAAALLDVAGATRWSGGGVLLGGLWLVAVLGWTLSLGATWRRRSGQLPWFAGWIWGGLATLALCVGAAGVGALFGWTDVLGRVAAAALLGGLTPIAAGLSVKMLPPMAGVGPAHRGAATVPGAVVAVVGWTVALGLLAAQPLVALLGVIGLAVLCGRAFRGLGWLASRRDGSPAVIAARMAPDARSLRWSGRLAWLSLGAALLVELASLGASASGLESIGMRPLRDAHVFGAHLLGTGFLVTLMLGVGQRLLPGFVRADVRWPRLRHAALLGMLLTIGLRAAAVLVPNDMPWALRGALVTLLFSVAMFHFQVAPSIRAPAPKAVS